MELFDYQQRGHDRRKMANYLRLDSCKFISGKALYDLKIRKRRLILSIAVAIVILVGLVFVFI